MSEPVVFNQLGSTAETTHSIKGSNFTEGSSVSYNSGGKFGDSLYSPNATPGDFEAVISASEIPLDDGAFEFWYTRTDTSFTAVWVNWIGHPIGSYSTGIQMWAYVSGGPEGRIAIDFAVSASSIGRYDWEFGDFDPDILALFPLNTPVHLGVCYSSSFALDNRIKLFIGGVDQGLRDVEPVEFTGSGTLAGGVIGHSGYAINNGGMGGVLDNYKAHNFAKTDFSDREDERGGLNDQMILL